MWTVGTHPAGGTHLSRKARPGPDTGQLAPLLDLIEDGMLVSDDSGRILLVNRSAATFLGCDTPDRPPADFLKNSDLARAIEQATRAGGGSATLWHSGPGGPVTLSLVSRPLGANGGHLFAHRLRDARSDAPRLEDLQQADKMSALGRLVAGVAHDLNNPLTSIVGYAQLLKLRDTDGRMQRGLEVIAAEAERAAKIVRNLLTFARKQPPERKPLGLNGVIEKTLELKLEDLRLSNIQVVTDLQPDLPYALADFHQMQQVLLNLLINAAQAMKGVKKGNRIRIRSRAVDGRIQVEVEDNGPGIPPEILPRIFDPFFSTKPAGEGTGLGLSICHGIMAEHGGSVRAVNLPEGGASFVLELPVLEAKDVPAGRTPGAAVPERGAREERTVLVVDDEPSIQDMLVAILTTQGHRVDTASTAEEALRKLRKRGYDVILTDLRMPGMSGTEFYNRLAATQSEVARRVVFMTGDLVGNESRDFLGRVGNLSLAKPFTMESLDRILRAFSSRFLKPTA